MKRPITPAYTFTPGSSSLNLSGVAGFDIRNLFAVIDLKTGALLYAPLAGYGYSALSGTTLTLQAPMAGLNAADPLLILYDDGGRPAEDGADIAGAAMPTGGGGIRGWLSALHTLLKGGAPNAARVSVSGSLAALNAGVTLAVDGMSVALVRATGTWAGTLSFTGSIDGGATFDVPLGMIPYAGSLAGGGGAAVSSTTTNGVWEVACGGLTHIIVGLSAYTSGSATVLLAAAHGLKSVRVGNPSGNPLTVTAGKPATAGDAAIASGGTAQTLFAGATPSNGWKIANPDVAEDLWVSDSATAAPNAQGSYRIPAGGIVTTEPGERPAGPVSVYGATTGHLVTARSW